MIATAPVEEKNRVKEFEAEVTRAAVAAETPPPDATPRAGRFMGYLQDVHLERTSLLLPESMRADFIWLGCYLRDRCNRSPDVLEAKFKDLGITVTSSTIVKVIEGKYITKWTDKKTKQAKQSPIISETKFKDVVERLRKQAQLDALTGKIAFVETESWDLVRDYIDERRAPARVCKFGLIIGKTGSQKTHTTKHYCLLNNHGTCVHLEAPETPSMPKFITELAKKYGVPPSASPEARTIAIHENVNKWKTIIVDNIQRLYKPKFGWNQPIFNFLQKLQDDTGCTIILICNLDSEFLKDILSKGFFAQFEGRCGGKEEFLYLPEHPSREDIRRIAAEFKVQSEERTLDALEKLARHRGAIRVLFHILQKAREEADAAGSRLITLDHIKEALDSRQTV